MDIRWLKSLGIIKFLGSYYETMQMEEQKIGKCVAKRILTKEEEKDLCQYFEEMVKWAYALAQLRIKVAQLTQTRAIPFTNGMLEISWLKWIQKYILNFY